MTLRRSSDDAPHFLLVEDNDLVAAAYRRVLVRFGNVTVATSVAEGHAALSRSHATGLVADVSLADGSGIDLAREARRRRMDLPILLISGRVDDIRLDVADEIGASYLIKPIATRQLARFAERATARQRRVSELIHSWIERYALSAAEAVTLRLAVDGLRRENIAAHRGVSPITAKHQISRMLAKVGAPTIPEMLVGFYRELSTRG